MRIQPYLMFSGRCEEALEYYQGALGAEVKMMMRFKDNPEPPPPGTMKPGTENKVMHAEMRIGESTILLSDGRCEEPSGFRGFTLTIITNSEDEAERVFNALGNGGQVQMPLTKTFFSPRFGMVADRFGVEWMIYVAH